MVSKSFVSLFFLSDKLQILQLSADRSKVKRIAAVDLPKGLVEGVVLPEEGGFAYKVKDALAVAKIIKTAWSKLHIREKSVGIIIPEFSSFTKVFSLPKLSLAELDEAVRWQAQEFLPANPKNLIMDWKIVKKTETEYQILLISVQKEVLDGFLASAEKAGLFPLVVATPSLVLATGTDKHKTGRLLVFSDNLESLVILCEAAKIVASVIVDNGAEDILKTSQKIISHFDTVKVEKVFLGGPKADTAFAQKLGSTLKKPVEWLNFDVKGLSDDAKKEYAITLALQQIESFEPVNTSTVNLLPVGLVMKYKSAKTRLQVWSLTLTVTLFIWICFFATLGAYLFISREIRSYKSVDSAKNQIVQQRKELAAKVKEINELSVNVGKIISISISPQTVFSDVESAVSPGISISGYEMDLDKGIIKVGGVAIDRPSLIEFKENLEENPKITNVLVPISNLEVESNVGFELTYEYEGEASPKVNAGQPVQ